MARAAIPDALGMRHLKYEPGVTNAQRDAVADALRAAGRIPEAILLYDGRADHPALRDDLAKAKADGVAFLVFALRKLGVPVTEDDIRACGAAAEAKGRWYDAFRCYESLADAPGLERVRVQLPGYKVAVPDNKK